MVISYKGLRKSMVLLSIQGVGPKVYFLPAGGGGGSSTQFASYYVPSKGRRGQTDRKPSAIS